MMQSYLTFDFDNLQKEVKKLQSRFEKNGLVVTDAVADEKSKRLSGFQTKGMTVFFSDGQKVELRVKKGGDVFQVKLNSTIIPVRNVGDLDKAVAEIALKVDGNSPKWLKAQRRKQQAQKVDSSDIKPRPISRKAKIETMQSSIAELQQIKAGLDEEQSQLKQQADERKATIEQLEQQLAG